MALNTQISEKVLNAQASVIISMLSSGSCTVYSGAQPPSADVPVSTQRALLVLPFSGPAAAAPVNGVIRFAQLGPSVVKESGVPTWYRCRSPSGEAVMDGTVGTVKCNMVLSSASLTEGANVTISEWSHSLRKTNG